MFKPYFAAVAGGLFICAAGVAGAAKPEKPAQPETQGKVAEAGMRAYVDPETGTLVSRPVTRAQIEALAQPEVDLGKIREVRNADGSTTWEFNGQVDEYLTVSRTEDGKLKLRCGEHGLVHDHALPASEVANDR